MTDTLRRLRTLRFLTAFFALAVLAASCGDDDSTTEADAAATSDEAMADDEAMEDEAMADDDAMEDDEAMADDEAMEDDAMADEAMEDDAMADEAMEDDAMAAAMENADIVIEATVAGGEVTVDEERVAVPLGSAVYIGVEGDVADEVHVHGYDLTTDLSPDHPAAVEFEADVAGLFEVELESSSTLLFEIEVS